MATKSNMIGFDNKMATAYKPLVSIITPVLNGEKYLEQCILSVLKQSYINIEHIFIDGGSTDDTLTILNNYSNKFKDRVRFITGRDKSPEDAWNKGIVMSKGEILGFLGADDTYFFDAVNTIVQFFQSTVNAHFVFGDALIINAQGNVTGKFTTRDFDLQDAINSHFVIPATSAFYKKQVVDKVGLLETGISPSDFEFFIRIGKVFKIHRIDKVLSAFRIHSGSASGSKTARKKYARAEYILCRRHGAKYFSYRTKDYLREILRPLFGFSYAYIKKLYRTIYSYF